jgi:hypothetical protein
VQHVADDPDPPPGDPAEPVAHRRRVEQRLRGVLVGAVAGVDHARGRSRTGRPDGARRRVTVRPVRHPMRRTGGRVAHDDAVGTYRG